MHGVYDVLECNIQKVTFDYLVALCAHISKKACEVAQPLNQKMPLFGQFCIGLLRFCCLGFVSSASSGCIDVLIWGGGRGVVVGWYSQGSAEEYGCGISRLSRHVVEASTFLGKTNGVGNIEGTERRGRA